MGAKAEIAWTRHDEEGRKVHVCARRVGGDWRFSLQANRFDQWEPLAQPPLEDWLALLDAVRRRIQRRLLRPEEAASVERRIHQYFPGTTLD